MKVIFDEKALDDYINWQNEDRKTLKRINNLIKDIQRSSFTGIGKPEPLIGENGKWSRRIDDSNRLVYQIVNENVEILQCRNHYKDK
ncbi:MAG: Txe/YoeB family addiction module toxin [Clostridiales bacterium]|jgi:toxin YoeB|nr:Txe/YoeB family addiction module toxin [Clostridiales bacterium]